MNAIAARDGSLAMDRVRRCLGNALAEVDLIRERYPDYLAGEKSD